MHTRYASEADNTRVRRGHQETCGRRGIISLAQDVFTLCNDADLHIPMFEEAKLGHAEPEAFDVAFHTRESLLEAAAYSGLSGSNLSAL